MYCKLNPTSTPSTDGGGGGGIKAPTIFALIINPPDHDTRIHDVLLWSIAHLFNPKCTGGGGGGASEAPLNKFYRALKTAALSAAPLHDFFP